MYFWRKFIFNTLGNHKHLNRLSVAGVLISLGVVYGDIGTSPLYTLKAIFSSVHGHGNHPIDKFIILGALSLIIWTLTLQTTLKYVVITLRADNKGEGGIFSLFSLVRKKAKWLIIPAIIGGCALLADGLITPSITVTSAIEGLKSKIPNVPVIPIVLVILTTLFVIQQFGTSIVGKLFGPVMLLWFSVLGISGIIYVIQDLSILNAFNPYWAVMLFVGNVKLAFAILGGVFLCTTGAEALYSDLGHCGRNNIRTSWVFVKSMLILNYLGQGVWVLNNLSIYNPETMNPFYQLIPEEYTVYMVLLATMAAIIASQALISGSFTLISEAVRLNIWPKIKISYPSDSKGQLYVPSINWMLWAGCCAIVLYFQESSKMEHAYGLSITIAMLMTTILVGVYLHSRRVPIYMISIGVFVYLVIEGTFLTGNLLKFFEGGWLTLLIGSVLFIIMWSWFKARKMKNKFVRFVEIEEYFDLIKDISEDTTIPKYASQLVYLTSANFNSEIESKVIYSIVNKQPKRADNYWFVHVDVVDEPYTSKYEVDTLIPDKLIRIDFKLGFRVEQRISVLFRKVVEDLVKNGEVTITSQHPSLEKRNITGDFRFILLEKHVSRLKDFKFFNRIVMQIYLILKKMSLSEERGFGLDSSFVDIEKVPLVFVTPDQVELKRVPSSNRNHGIRI